MSLISVILPVIGGSQYTESCLKSIFNSTYRNLEVILVSDDIEEIKRITEFEYGNHIIYVETNDVNIVKARNIGIKYSRGELIAMMDVKDITGKMRFELEVIKLTQNGNMGMAFCGMTFIDDAGNFLKGVKLIPKYEKNKFLGLMYEKNRIDTVSTTLIKRDVIDNIGQFDEELVYYSEYDFWLRVARRYNVEYLDLPLLRFRMNVQNNVDNFESRLREEEDLKVLLKHDVGEIAQSISRIYDNEEEFRLSLGSVLYRMGKKDDAMKNFRKVLSLNSQNGQAYFMIGNCYFDSGQYKEAKIYYEESLSLNPNHAECRNNFGVLLFREGEEKWSIEEFRKAQMLKENYLDPTFNLECMKCRKSFNDMKITDF